MSKPEAPEISVVVPHYNQLAGLKDCLASLARQSLAKDRYEIVVVDNGSAVDEAEIRAITDGIASLVIEPTKGAGPARNRGVKESKGAILAFIDADCVASDAWLAEGLRGLKAHDVVGGRVDVSVENDNRMTGPEAFERVFAFDFRNYIEQKGFTGSGNLFCRRSVFDAVGGFRRAVSEDLDWSLRATGAGFTLGYHDAAAISHPARSTWSELVRKWDRLNRESLALAKERKNGEARYLARSYLLPLSILPHGWRVLTSNKLPNTRSKLKALATLARIRLWRFADSHRALFEVSKY